MPNTYFFYTILFLAALDVILIVLLLRLRAKFKIFLSGSKGKNWEEALQRQVQDVKRLVFKIQDLEKRQKVLEAIAKKSTQKIGLVRYNPFQEIGGNQSFSLAVLDNTDGGFVLSALFATERSRVYIKPIKNAKSSLPLTKEEQEAIEQAKANKVPLL